MHFYTKNTALQISEKGPLVSKTVKLVFGLYFRKLIERRVAEIYVSNKISYNFTKFVVTLNVETRRRIEIGFFNVLAVRN